MLRTIGWALFLVLSASGSNIARAEKSFLISGKCKSAVLPINCESDYTFTWKSLGFDLGGDVLVGAQIAIGQGALPLRINSRAQNAFTLSPTASVQFWFAGGFLGVSALLTLKPPYDDGDDIIVGTGDGQFAYKTANVVRFPLGVGLSFVWDLLFVGFMFDQLYNGDEYSRRMAYNQNLPRNSVVASAPVFFITISPVNFTRNIIASTIREPTPTRGAE